MSIVFEQNLPGFPTSTSKPGIQIGQTVKGIAATCAFIKRVLALSSFLFLVGLFTHATDSQAQGWLYVFECSDLQSARSCNACSVKGGNEVRFIVRTNIMSVIRQYRENGVTQSPNELENCTILDEKNWSCRKALTNEREDRNSVFTHRMSWHTEAVDGKVWETSTNSFGIRYFGPPPIPIQRPPKISSSYSCFK